MEMTRFEKVIAEHNGRITARDDAGTVFRVDFPISTRAAGFYDDMISRNVNAELQTGNNWCTVVVQF